MSLRLSDSSTRRAAIRFSGYGLRITDYAFRAFIALFLMACPSFASQPLERGKVATWYYRCDLDDTDQPYSLWLPKDYSADRKWPLAVQLHGLGGSYRIGGPPKELEDFVVAAPDGRGNTDYKLWGELDVVRVVEDVQARLSIDPDRVVLYGFSMGGSGSWQVGVHFPDRFAALGPVCGNADHRVWERLWNWGETNPTWMSPRKAWVEATESPAFFAENLLNLPSMPLHGDKDNVVPCDHSRSMAAELKKAGAPCFYVEVPGAGHGVPGDKVSDMLKWLREQKREPWPKRVVFKTAWRRHPGAYWVRLHRFERAFAFARIEAEALDRTSANVKTDNLEEFSLHLAAPLFDPAQPIRVRVDGVEQYRGKAPADGWLRLRKQGGKWAPSKEPEGLHKTATLEGPVEHAFMTSFVIVFGTSGDDERAKRVAADEARLLADFWNRWARGKCRIKADREVTDDDIARCSLILVGDPATNSLIPRVTPTLPIRIEGKSIAFGGKRYEGDDLGLKLVYPNPLNPQRYVVLFTGTTWRGVFEIIGRFGNWFDWGILDGFHWADFEVFDNLTYSPETALAIGYFDNDWRLNPDWYVTGDEKLRRARPPRRTPEHRTPPEGAGELFLSDLEPAYTRPEKGCVARDRSFNAFPLTLGGRTFDRGLGIHPNCEIGFNLDGRFSVFEAVVGSDLEGEAAVSKARDEAESFEFMVVGDGRMLFQTGRLKWNSEPRHLYVPIPGVRHLELKMHRRSGPRWLSGPADWAIARVGEPLHNRVAVRPKAEGPERLVEALPLDGAWRLAGFPVGAGIGREAHRASSAAQAEAIPAPVPGSVYTALGLGPRDEAMLRDVADTEWWYWRELDIPRHWAGRSVWLELDGAAYQADAWLNGRWVGRSAGPFVPGRFDATLGAKLGERNTVSVRVVGSPADFVKGGEPFRPAPARRLVTAQALADPGTPPLGLWQPARLRSAGPCLLRDLAIETVQLTDAAARLRVSAEIVSLANERLEVALAGVVSPPREPRDGDVPPTVAFEQKATVEGSKASRVEAEVLLPQPKLWWPRGLGDQPLYRLAASVRLDGGAVSDEAELGFGLRSVELAPYDGIARLRVNGQGVDILGAMWLPADAALRLDAARYERLLARARECGFNTLRVAGGGLAETDLFYGLCDREGFLVIQELPLAGEGHGIGADEYLANAAAAVRRIRSHPSLVAWCVGGAPGGSPDPRLTADAAALCLRLDPTRRLVGDSPRTGPAALWTTRPDAVGRTHWLGASLRHVPGLPAPSALCLDARGDPEWPCGEAWAIASARSAAPYGPSQSARQHILKAQAAQAAAGRAAAERHRRAPAAEVFWQLDEPAPAASPALVDAAGAPKPASFFVRRALADVSIFADFGSDQPPCVPAGASLHVEVCVENRSAPLRNARAVATVLDRSMQPRFLRESRFDAEQAVVSRPLAFDWSAGWALAGDVCFLHLSLSDAGGQALASNLYWIGVTPPKGGAVGRGPRVAWFGARPPGLLADEAFLAATGIVAERPPAAPADQPSAARGPDPAEKPRLDLSGYDAIVVDAAAGFAEFTEDDLRAVASAVSKGCGLLVEGMDRALFDSALASALPVRRAPGAAGPAGVPVAAMPDHPAVARLAFALCPAVSPSEALEALPEADVLVELDGRRPLVIEGRHGQGRVLVLAASLGGVLGAWSDAARFTAGLLGYLARLPHGELGRLVAAAEPMPFHALDRLAPATLDARLRQDGDAAAVEVRNVSPALAFLVNLEAAGHGAADLTYSDNFLSLLPGENRVIRIEGLGPAHTAGAGQPRTFSLTLGGWNVAPRRLQGSLEVQGGRLHVRAP